MTRITNAKYTVVNGIVIEKMNTFGGEKLRKQDLLHGLPICAAFLCFDKLFTNQWMDNSWMDTIRVLYIKVKRTKQPILNAISMLTNVEHMRCHTPSSVISSAKSGNVWFISIFEHGDRMPILYSNTTEWSWWYFTVNVFFISRNKIFKTTIVPNGDRLFYIWVISFVSWFSCCFSNLANRSGKKPQ